jgi:hypothetical protein
MKPYTRVRFGRELPAGISLVSAVTIQQAIDIWPVLDNVEVAMDRKAGKLLH